MTVPSDSAAASIGADLRQARKELLRGRGPGAGDAEITAHTRNRFLIAGVPATRRLEMAARQTARARQDVDAITYVVELNRAELADTLTQLTGRLRPRQLAFVVVDRLRARFNAHPAPFLLGGAALVLLVWARRASDQRDAAIPQAALVISPGPSLMSPSPVRNALGAHVIGSTPRPVRK